MEEKSFLEGARAALPTVFGYISIGLAFGIVASKAGINPIGVALMSALVYSGSGQFALCALLIAKASLPTIATTILLINLRNFLMNLHVTTIFPSASLPQQLLVGSFMADESYGALLGERLHHHQVSLQWMHGNNLAGYLTWLISTIIGCLLGNLIPNPDGLGIDFALLAMFVAIFANQLEGMLRTLSSGKVGWILLSVFVSYFVFSMFLSGSIAVLLVTLLGCFVGVIVDD